MTVAALVMMMYFLSILLYGLMTMLLMIVTAALVMKIGIRMEDFDHDDVAAETQDWGVQHKRWLFDCLSMDYSLGCFDEKNQCHDPDDSDV